MITARTSIIETPLIVWVSENHSVRPWMKVPIPSVTISEWMRK